MNLETKITIYKFTPQLFTLTHNIRSKRLCERLGMRREGCFKEFVTFVNNPDGSPKYEDTCVYAILEKEWNTIRQW